MKQWNWPIGYGILVYKSRLGELLDRKLLHFSLDFFTFDIYVDDNVRMFLLCANTV